MSFATTRQIFAVSLAVALVGTTLVGAQNPTTPESLARQIAELEASGESPAALAALREASTSNAKARDLAAAAEDFRRQIEQIPGLLQNARASLSAPLPPAPDEKELNTRPLTELEATLTQTKTALEQARTRQQKLEAELQQRALREKTIPTANTTLASTLDELSSALASAPPLPPNPTPETLADHTRMLARQALLRQTIATNERELAFIKSSADLSAADNSLAAREVKQLTDALGLLQPVFDSRNQRQANTQAAEAQNDPALDTDNADLAELAREIAELTALRAGANAPLPDTFVGVTEQLGIANDALTTITSKLARVTEDYRNAKLRVDLVAEAGFSLGETTGNLLREERGNLPDPAELRSQLRTALHDNTEAGLELIKRAKQRDDLVLNFEQKIESIADLSQDATDAERALTREAARQLLDKKQEILEQLIADYRKLTAALSEANQHRRLLINRTQAYARLIDERVLWFRSSPIIDKKALLDGKHSLASLFSKTRWSDFFLNLAQDFRSNLALWIGAMLAVALLVALRPSHKRHLLNTATTAARKTCRTYLPTAKALIYTILLTIPGPIALSFVAFRHGGIDQGGIATGLYEVACHLIFFGFLRRVCYCDGLAVAHFRLAPGQAKSLHRLLTSFLWFVVAVGFVLGVLDSPDGNPGARIIFIAAMLVFAVFVSFLLNSKRHIVTSAGLRFGAFLMGTIAPIVLAAGAAAGYFYTVRELQWRLEASFVLALFLLLLSALIQRWFLVARRRLAIDQARKKQRAAAEAASAADTVTLTQEEIESATIDITKIKDQTRQLLNSTTALALALGLWGIWAQVLPALTILDDVHLWPDTTELAASGSNVETSAAGASATALPALTSTLPTAETSPTTNNQTAAVATRELPRSITDPNFGWVTLADLALSILAFILTYIAAKNIPGLLDISILHRLDLKPGGSYAVTASARYLIVLIGIILAFSQIGITWSKVQWIAAAVTVGIGFGLQEVFANFVAGLILLFERPIRLGDFVTIGTTSGQVTRIEIRATTIRDFSNKELIVPNKEFITGQLVNWTLTDSVIRVEIPVGIAYGSDTALAHKLLEKIGNDHPHTTTDPAAQAVFLNFGASSLDFELRVHITSAQNIISVRNDLNFAIDQAFREHNIEIAFPQTDIHIRSMPPQPTAGA